MYCSYYDSPVGKLLLTCREEGLTGIWFDRAIPADTKRENHPILQQTKQWLDAYFRGENPSIDMPVLPEGTAFQQQVWKLLLEIPYGKTRTYGDLSREIERFTGKEKMSAQAVGQAVGRNSRQHSDPLSPGRGGKGTADRLRRRFGPENPAAAAGRPSD